MKRLRQVMLHREERQGERKGSLPIQIWLKGLRKWRQFERQQQKPLILYNSCFILRTVVLYSCTLAYKSTSIPPTHLPVSLIWLSTVHPFQLNLSTTTILWLLPPWSTSPLPLPPPSETTQQQTTFSNNTLIVPFCGGGGGGGVRRGQT
jgi:hypothetical protein